ncbi:hypothetical protein BN946_scf185042.g111 [Trametes cinnabarina]|uniref:Glutamate--cysteine ligase n=1 Tax=Pycnoporus cinnabarinus TaxID=5643 RepID=A0A060SA92_PYCCI|nr:hypothetical protein BN946_scf185042.g111 [Trametes cinnabarina]
MVAIFDDKDKSAKLSLRQTEILTKLQKIVADIASDRGESESVPTFHPEYGRFMLESTPGSPYTGEIRDLLSVESNMRYRRHLARKYLKSNEVPFTMTSFPRMGVPGVFTEPYYDPVDAVSSHSLFLPEEITNPHARFPSVTLYLVTSPRLNLSPLVGPSLPTLDEDGAQSCLQITFQACNITEARRLYDALIPIAPLMRQPLKENRFRIPKSRYASVSLYISEYWMNQPAYNDIEAPHDPAIYERLRKHGVDELLSRHIAHLFIRDPLVIFSESIDQDDTISNDHFENIQSTNWQTLRFKPPPANSSIGWRVEFRPMEVQMTDFENAVFSVFVVLLSRAILHFNLNLYIPISKVDANMARAQKRDAVHSQKFYFRKDVFPPGPSQPSSIASSCPSTPVSEHGGPILLNGVNGKEKKLRNCYPLPPKPDDASPSGAVDDEYEEMTLQEIMNGKGSAFPGLLNLVYAYLETLDMDEESAREIEAYLDLIRRRTNGSLRTAASWIRNFVRSHPAYKFDSVVSQEINYDLMVAVDEMCVSLHMRWMSDH